MSVPDPTAVLLAGTLGSGTTVVAEPLPVPETRSATIRRLLAQRQGSRVFTIDLKPDRRHGRNEHRDPAAVLALRTSEVRALRRGPAAGR